MKFVNPKNMSDQCLWKCMLNLFPKNAPVEFQNWYREIEKEFKSRKIKLTPICK